MTVPMQAHVASLRCEAVEPTREVRTGRLEQVSVSIYIPRSLHDSSETLRGAYEAEEDI